MVQSNLDTCNDFEGSILSADSIEKIELAINSNNADELNILISQYHSADIADLIEFLSPSYRRKFARLLGGNLNYDFLSELNEIAMDDILSMLPSKIIIKAVQQFDTDDALHLIEHLDKDKQDKILAKLPKDDRLFVRRGLNYPEDSAGRLMRREYLSVAYFWTVGETIDYIRKSNNLPTDFTEIFIINNSILVSSVSLSYILRSERSTKINTIMDDKFRRFSVLDDQEDVAHQFEKYHLTSATVIDANGRLAGVITIDDIVNVIREEAEEDIHLLAGVGNYGLNDNILRTTWSRFSWLFVNLVTAILGSIVIGFFDTTIDKMVSLAILMPIVASMGGNAATQTSTIAVRAIATHELIPLNYNRFIFKEAFIGLINGLIFAIITAVIVIMWFGSNQLGVIIAVALIFNMFLAAISGILIPLLLNYMDFDPAISSSIFVTTITDVFGFFSFLGLASIWMV